MSVDIASGSTANLSLSGGIFVALLQFLDWRRESNIIAVAHYRSSKMKNSTPSHHEDTNFLRRKPKSSEIAQRVQLNHTAQRRAMSLLLHVNPRYFEDYCSKGKVELSEKKINFSNQKSKSPSLGLAYTQSLRNIQNGAEYGFVAAGYALPKMKLHELEVDPDVQSSEEINCGEDAFFIANSSNASKTKHQCNAIGVADGVGGWTQLGVDPSEISRELMKNCRSIMENESSQGGLTKTSPGEVLINAYNQLISQKKVTAGSTTACIVQIKSCLESNKHTIQAANLGDSGFIVFRNRENRYIKSFKSNSQQHTFNCPYQLAIIPQHMKNKGKQFITDKPSDANLLSFDAKEDDLIILATDGLFDNLFDDEIMDIAENTINKTIIQKQQLQECAKQLCLKARERAHSSEESPFSRLHNSLMMSNQSGGKLDDVTVVVAIVKNIQKTLSHSADCPNISHFESLHMS